MASKPPPPQTRGSQKSEQCELAMQVIMASVHRVLQGVAQRGAQFHFIFAFLRTLCLMQQNEPFQP